jgi:hypothetical protein
MDITDKNKLHLDEVAWRKILRARAAIEQTQGPAKLVSTPLRSNLTPERSVPYQTKSQERVRTLPEDIETVTSKETADDQAIVPSVIKPVINADLLTSPNTSGAKSATTKMVTSDQSVSHHSLFVEPLSHSTHVLAWPKLYDRPPLKLTMRPQRKLKPKNPTKMLASKHRMPPKLRPAQQRLRSADRRITRIYNLWTIGSAKMSTANTQCLSGE